MEMMYGVTGARPPPITTDLPPAKRARIPTVSPMHTSMGGGLNACYDPHMLLKANAFPNPMRQTLGACKRVVTPQRGGASTAVSTSSSPAAAKTGRWTKREDEKLRCTVESMGPSHSWDWAKMSKLAFNGARSDAQCAERWEKVLKLGLVKGPWTPHEDEIVRAAVGKGIDASFNWSEVAKLLPGRLTKQVRERWQNHLDPALVKTPWTASEDFLLVSLQAVLGNRWNEISRAFQGRSENAIKNRWNSKQRRRFLHPNSNDRRPPDASPATAAAPPLARYPSPRAIAAPKVAAVNFREALLTAFGSDREQEAATILHKLRADDRDADVKPIPVS